MSRNLTSIYFGDIANQGCRWFVASIVDPVNGILILWESAEGRGFERVLAIGLSFDPGPFDHCDNTGSIFVAVFRYLATWCNFLARILRPDWSRRPYFRHSLDI